MHVQVAISRFHAGDPVTPRVSCQAAGREQVKLSLVWHDASDNSVTAPVTFKGSVQDAEKFLQAQGVRLDAQGICWR